MRALAAATGLSTAAAAAPPAAPGGIYTCVDDKGRRLTSDRPIAECTSREQHILNKDGSIKAVVPPTMTPEERAEKEARERKAAELRMAQAEVVRRDKNLVLRYPNEAAHRKAREVALEPVRMALKSSEQRLKDLANERRPLLEEAEFYKGKPLPAKLKSLMDANDAAVDAQRSAAASQEAELGRVNRIFDVELARLQKLWAGAQPGTLGPMPSPNAEPGSAATSIVPASAAR